MKVSRNSLINSYDVQKEKFFANRFDRDVYFIEHVADLTEGALCAVGGDPENSDWETPEWELEMYNGANWTLQTLDPNYALVVTNEGIKALSYISQTSAEYKLKISAIKVKAHNIISPSIPLTQWTDDEFRYGGDVILNSKGNNPNFKIDLGNSVLSWKLNLQNGGLQFCVDFKQSLVADNGDVDFTIGAIGLYVQNPNNRGEDILFAIGNLSQPIPKYTTTSNRVGNNIRLYMNTILDNLGYVADMSIFPENVSSLPEVGTVEELTENYAPLVSAPYNVYLVNDLNGTNIPALAVRTGDPAKDTLGWTFFTPSDDTLIIEDPSTISPDLKDYMMAAWDSDKNQFAPANGGTAGEEPITQDKSTIGMKIGNRIVYSGTISNFTDNYKYTSQISQEGAGTNYSVGDILTYRAYDNNYGSEGAYVDFKVVVSNVSTDGAITQYILTPSLGDPKINEENCVFTLKSADSKGTGFMLDIASQDNTLNVYAWDFPANYLNQPLYIDTNHISEGGENRCGKFTITETKIFAGWCVATGTKSAVKLALDLRNEATYYDYGTTRYASSLEVLQGGNGPAGQLRAVTPKELKETYIQKIALDDDAGSSLQNPIEVETYLKFDHPVIGSNITNIPSTIDETSISFYGTAYRAMWADLAEYYRADKAYIPGTLITIGKGSAEITIAEHECNGIISTKPGYELGQKQDELDLPVALVGKVPVLMAKDCMPKFGDRIYLSIEQPGYASTTVNGKCLGKIIDKRENLEQYDTVMCSVRVSF